MKMIKKHFYEILIGIIICVSITETIIYFNPSVQNRINAELKLTKDFSNIENSQSELLSSLIKKEDFSNDYKWYGSTYTQYDIQPNLNRLYLEEVAEAILLGYYKEHNIEITNIIQKYQTQPKASDLNNIYLAVFPASKLIKDLNVNVATMSHNQISKCGYVSNNTTSCYIVFSNNNKIIFVIIEIRQYVTSSILSSIIDPVLETVKKKIEVTSH